MLVCIAGKNNIAVNVLKYLFERYDKEVELGVVYNRDECGQDGWQRSLKKYADLHGVKEYKLEELYKVKDLIFLSLEFDRIIQPNKFVSNELFNIHFSALPKYKGMYTAVIPILNGENQGGVTLHKIETGIDTGDIREQILFELLLTDTSRDLYFRCLEYGTSLVIKNIDSILNRRYTTVQQSKEKSTYYSKSYIDYSDLKYDLNVTAEGLSRQIKAFTFREYQMPVIYGHAISDIKISDIKSSKKAGTILYETEETMMLSTIDYNVVLFFDKFEQVMNACRTGEIDNVKRLCANGLYINEKNEKGWAPIVVATYNNQKEIVKYLISIGADIKVTNNNGTNLLMYAKDAYLDTGDDELLLLYRELGLSARQMDYLERNLFSYIYDGKITEERKLHLYNLFRDEFVQLKELEKNKMTKNFAGGGQIVFKFSEFCCRKEQVA